MIRLKLTSIIVAIFLIGGLMNFTSGADNNASNAAREPAPDAPVSWDAELKLEGEQKYQEAVEIVEKLLVKARERADHSDWTKCLIRITQLKMSLHGYEEAVKFLLSQSWPDHTESQCLLNIFSAETLDSYYQAYSWEINARESIVSADVLDLKKWAKAQIFAKEEALLAKAWDQREFLGSIDVSKWKDYIVRNGYPADLRSSVRDFLTYYRASLLSDSHRWTPQEEAELYKLDFIRMIEPSGSLPPAAPESHSLLRSLALLDDLYSWHSSTKNRANMLESQLERIRIIQQHYAKKSENEKIRAAFLNLTKQYEDTSWWSSAVYEYAQSILKCGDPVQSRETARTGVTKYPESMGAKLCKALISQIEQPEFSLQTSAVDKLDAPSIQLTHKNMTKLYFRAYALNIDEIIKKSDYWRFEPNWNIYPKIVHERKPNYSWESTLEDPKDFQNHITYVTPPIKTHGLYVIAASTRPDFAKMDNRIDGVTMQISPITLSRTETNQNIEFLITNGETGQPVSEAYVFLYPIIHESSARPTLQKMTDKNGRALFSRASMSNRCLTPVVKWKDITFFDPDCISSYIQTESMYNAELIYTDRSIYRPGQKIFFKTLSYQGKGSDFSIAPNKKVHVKLTDPNGEEVAKADLTTNDFGTASGEFVIPTGRVLGSYQLIAGNGSAHIRVEEYKRPTFELEIEIPEKEMKLNEPASFKGNAAYYFGMPVSSGNVVWKITRETVWPFWWWWRYGLNPNAGAALQIAAGKSPIKEDGSFEIDFTPEGDPEAENKESLSYTFRITADVTDDGGETRSSTQTMRLGYCAVSATLSMDSLYFPTGAAAKIDAHRQDLNGQPRPGKGSYEIFSLIQPEETTNASQLPVPERSNQPAKRISGDLQQPRWAAEPGDQQRMFSWKDSKKITSGEVSHDREGKGTIPIEPLEKGAYRIYYTTQDARGVPFKTQKEFLVLAKGADIHLPLIAVVDKMIAKPGEIVTCFAGSGFKDQMLWVEVAQGQKLIRRETLQSSDGLVDVKINVDETFRGGFSIQTYLVHDYQLYSTQMPVSVPWDNKNLKLEFATFRDLLKPGQKETWTIRVKGPNSEAAAAELLAYMYDRSLDFFSPHSYPSIGNLYPTWYFSTPINGWTTSKSAVRFLDHHWREAVYASGYSPDSFLGYSGYGIGGPGRRDTVRMMAKMKGAPEESMAVDSAAVGDEGVGMEGGVAGSGKLDAAPPPAPAAENAPIVNKPTAATEQTAQTEQPIRENFAETAFFEPHLLTDADGNASISFTVPDSVTSWKVYVHAMTKDLKWMTLQKETETRKDLMVRPYLPRFFREGDRGVLKIVLNNAGDKDLSGTVKLEILDPETGQDATSLFSPSKTNLEWSARSKESTDVSVSLKAPSILGIYSFKVTAQADGLSDGELRPLPILPGRVHLSQTRFVTLKNDDRRTMTIPDMAAAAGDPTLINESLVVGVDGQLIYQVLRALPYLVNYPYECVEQTLNRFVSTGIITSVYTKYPAIARAAEEFSKRDTPLEKWDLDDPNRRMALAETPWMTEAKGGRADLPLINVLDRKIAEKHRKDSMQKLKKAQLPSGAFPWFPGGEASPYMTTYLLYGFAKAVEFQVDVPRDVISRMCEYLGDYYRDYYVKQMKLDDYGPESIVFLNYVLSCFPDASYFKSGFSETERADMLAYCFRHWKEIAPYCKAMLSLTLSRENRKTDAALVMDSIMDSSKTAQDQGTFWAPEDRGWLWYNDTIETHAMILRALMEVKPADERSDGLALWLFLNKKMNQWKSTRATAEVIYSLVHYLKSKDALGVKEEVTAKMGDLTRSFAFNPDEYQEAGKKQWVIDGPDVQPEAMSTVDVEKKGAGFMFASMNWRYSTEKMPEEARGDFIRVTREYFLRINEGGKMVLKPLKEGATLNVGDELEVHLSLQTKHPMEYMHLMDPRGAGFEPENQISGHRWDFGIVWYEEIRDSATNFFFEWLPQGEYTFKYRMRAAMSGKFKAGPATLESLYAPEFSAFSSGASLEIR